MSRLEELIAKASVEAIKDRRHIHANAELSNEEFETSAYIAKNLEAMQVKYERQSTSTSVIAFLNKGKAKKKLAFRADMDALPIQEETELAFSSKNKNCMHACGHDAHTAILLGAIRVLKAYESDLKAELVFIFQAAEEDSPNGGAKRVLESGILQGVDEIYGLHVWPEAPLGEIWVKEGAFMGASDYFSVKIQGQSAHAAQPQKSIDALIAASVWVNQIQALFARSFSAFDKVILSIGKMSAGTKHNIIADLAILEGTCRSFDETKRKLLHDLLIHSLKGLDESFKTKSTCEIKRGYDALCNDKEAVAFAQKAMQDFKLCVRKAKESSLCAEDFAFYLKDIKGAFFWLGSGSTYPLHHPKFDIDESIISVGILAFVSLALSAK